MSTTQELIPPQEVVVDTDLAPAKDMAPANTDRDRREHRRYPLVPQFSRIIVADPEEGCVEGHVHDVSESGILFECDAFFGVDEVVDFLIELPGSAGSIGGRAQITRTPDQDDLVGPWMMAASFLEFQDRFQPASLMQFIKQNDIQAA